MTAAELERLAILAEEMGEAIQIIGKIIRHSYLSRHPRGGPTNKELLVTELGHVRYAMELMASRGDFDVVDILESADRKKVSIQGFLHFQD